MENATVLVAEFGEARSTDQHILQLKWWSWALLGLALLCTGWGLAMLLAAVFGPAFAIYLPTEEGVVALGESDFTLAQRLILTAILGMTDVLFCIAFAQIVLLARRFSHGEILTDGVVTLVSRFGQFLLAAGIAEFLGMPTAVYYLQVLGKVGPVPYVWLEAWGEIIILLTASMFVLIIARVFRVGVEMRKDLELTI